VNNKAQSQIDICDKFIRPTIEASGWADSSQMYREYALRTVQFVVRGRQAWREAPTVLRADYALFFKTNIPLVVDEAKDNNQAMVAGMPQASNCAQLLDVLFSLASKGDGFIFRDATLSDDVLERNLTLDEFPLPGALWSRHYARKSWARNNRRITEHE